MKLRFSKANAKLSRLQMKKGKVYSLDLLSGHSCPFAKKCLAKVIETPNGLKIKDGPDSEFRCYSASQEALFKNVYKLRKQNFELLKHKSKEEMVKLLADSLPKDYAVIRIHSAGEFFSQDYFDAWLETAKNNPTKLFYAYTKSLPYWIKRKNEIPKNFVLTASYGGRQDNLIEKSHLRYAKVVMSHYEARKEKLPIDHDDSHAAKNGKSFALLVHGVQPANTKASVAVRRLKGTGSYSTTKNKEQGYQLRQS